MLLRRSSRCSTHASLPNYYGKIIITAQRFDGSTEKQNSDIPCPSAFLEAVETNRALQVF